MVGFRRAKTKFEGRIDWLPTLASFAAKGRVGFETIRIKSLELVSVNAEYSVFKDRDFVHYSLGTGTSL